MSTFETLKKNYYFCNKCGKIFSQSENILFVEDNSPRGFCSESCIEEFYRPMVRLFEKVENELRKKLGLLKEDSLKYLEFPHYLENLLKKPSEIWVNENDLKEKYYFIISPFKDKEGMDFYLASICLFHQNRPSFLFLVTASSDKDFINEFRYGKQVNQEISVLSSPQDKKEAKLFQKVERKRAYLLSELLKMRNDTDISFFIGI